MTYIYQCDGFCDPGERTHQSRPAFMGELNETWFETSPVGDYLKDEGYSPAQTITLCPDCTEQLLLHS